VVSERHAAKEELGAIQIKHCVDVGLDLLVGPSEDWAECEIREASLGCLCGELCV
jgi:hypothetical protein